MLDYQQYKAKDLLKVFSSPEPIEEAKELRERVRGEDYVYADAGDCSGYPNTVPISDQRGWNDYCMGDG